jgi:hypothetical protein
MPSSLPTRNPRAQSSVHPSRLHRATLPSGSIALLSFILSFLFSLLRSYARMSLGRLCLEPCHPSCRPHSFSLAREGRSTRRGWVVSSAPFLQVGGGPQFPGLYFDVGCSRNRRQLLMRRDVPIPQFTPEPPARPWFLHFPVSSVREPIHVLCPPPFKPHRSHSVSHPSRPPPVHRFLFTSSASCPCFRGAPQRVGLRSERGGPKTEERKHSESLVGRFKLVIN